MSDGETGRTGTARPQTDAAGIEDPRVAGEAGGLEGLVVVCGLPGVGKTTVARYIAERSDAVVFRTDVVRKELFPDPDYSERETRTVYAELLSRAGDVLDDGRTAVLDATFAESGFRDDARALAEELDVAFHLVKVECRTAVVEDRIRQRDGLSDADFDVHLMFREEYDPVELEHHAVDNSGSEAETVRQIERLL